MLTTNDNELLTLVGPGTSGGAVIREYWLPFLLSDELPPDGPPLRIRLMGENFIAFRTGSRSVGLVQNACPHRGASMFFGRNEEEGLRCVYHGWKFDSAGNCVDMPSEPVESNFKSKVHALAYECRERNGVVWTYMGKRSPAPPLPELEWNLMPREQCYVSKRVQRCNWFQALEGGIDSSHSNFVHAPLRPTDPGEGRAIFRITSKSLHFETRNTEYGVIVANRRPADEGNVYWRMNHYVMPFYTMFPPTGSRPDTPISGHAWVPIDDEETLVFHWSYNPRQALNENQLASMQHGMNGLDGFHLSFESHLEPTTAPNGAWYPKQRAENDYLLDYEAQRTIRFSGVPGGWNQDAAVQESMGSITQRTREHLGTSDSGIIAARRYFITAAKAMRDTGTLPPGSKDASVFRIRPAEAVMAPDKDWLQELNSGALQPRLAPMPVTGR